MSMIHFNPEDVRLKKFAATTTSGSKKTTSVVRIELTTTDPYALASILRQLEEVETEQRVADSIARQAAAAAKRPRVQERIPAPPSTLRLPYRGDDI